MELASLSVSPDISLCLNSFVKLLPVFEAFERKPKTAAADYPTHIKASSKSNLICGSGECLALIPRLGNTPALRDILEVTPHQTYK